MHVRTLVLVLGSLLSGAAFAQGAATETQRNVDQQQRINQGVRSGEVTNREAANLERGQARTTGREAAAGANGHVSAGEQARVQGAENRQSNRVYKRKHNDAERNGN